MKVFVKVDALREHLDITRKSGKTIGFVPTMGALHEGHLDLVRKSIRENDVTICSVFVNPTQFNDKKDLDKYPRTLEKDTSMLRSVGTDVVFAPEVDDVYPKGVVIEVPDLNGLDTLMEGEFRPGHFKGVVQVVRRLLDITEPDRLYMGQKDFQQFTIIAHMLRQINSPVTLVVCRTKREKNGLAMSSRNQRLSTDIKQKAGLIFRVLTAVKKRYGKESPSSLMEYAQKRLSTPDFNPEYFMIVDGNTLQPIQNYQKGQYAVACVAVWAEGVRLIDNMILEKG